MFFMNDCRYDTSNWAASNHPLAGEVEFQQGYVEAYEENWAIQSVNVC